MSLSLSLSLYATNLCIFHLVLSWLVLFCLEWTSITIVIIGMKLYELVLHYIIISYHISCFFILSLLLIWSPFYSILFNLIYYVVQYSISYQWMICVYLSVCLFVCLFICMNKFIFSLLSCFLILSLLFLFSFHFHFSFFTLFLWTSSSHTHTDTDTHIHMNICSFLWLVHITSIVNKWRIVFEW